MYRAFVGGRWLPWVSNADPVSYTHLDVYKRQAVGCGYGVYVPQRTEEAQQILQRSGIRILGRMERADLR